MLSVQPEQVELSPFITPQSSKQLELSPFGTPQLSKQVELSPFGTSHSSKQDVSSLQDPQTPSHDVPSP